MSDPQNSGESAERLDQIPTQWSLLNLAHHDSVTKAGPARNALVLRYSKAIRGYVGALLKDRQDADDLSHEVLVRMLGGDFASAQPERGRFRDLLRVAVRNMVRNFVNRKGSRVAGGYDVSQLPDATVDQQHESAWQETWRKSVLDQTWFAMQTAEKSRKGNLYYTVLKLRVDHPDDDSPRLARRVSESAGKEVSPEAARQMLHRARERFAQLLSKEVARSLDQPSPEEIHSELADLGLMEYVKDFLPEQDS